MCFRTLLCVFLLLLCGTDFSCVSKHLSLFEPLKNTYIECRRTSRAHRIINLQIVIELNASQPVVVSRRQRLIQPAGHQSRRIRPIILHLRVNIATTQCIRGVVIDRQRPCRERILDHVLESTRVIHLPGHLTSQQRWFIAFKTKIQLPNTLPIILTV